LSAAAMGAPGGSAPIALGRGAGGDRSGVVRGVRDGRRDLRVDLDGVRVVLPEWSAAVPRAFALLPDTVGIVSAAFEGQRSGVLATKIMRCGDEPPSIAVAMPKGHRLATLIRDNHGFAITLIEKPSKLMLRRFGPGSDSGLVARAGLGRGDDARVRTGVIDRSDDDDAGLHEDPFEAIPTRTLATGAPILVTGIAALDCEVSRHIDFDGDHELYIGQVIAAVVLRAASPAASGADVADMPHVAASAPASAATSTSVPVSRARATPGRSAGKSSGPESTAPRQSPGTRPARETPESKRAGGT
jgi:flavin reductase (DIM6/NTAB) family NADH-FMN oxidoreductase RutF